MGVSQNGMKKWKVRSKSEKNKIYQVTMVTEWDWECTCPQFIHRHVPCKHIKGVQAAYDKQNRKRQNNGHQLQAAKVSSNSGRPGDRRNTVQSGQLRGSTQHNGNITGNNPGVKPSQATGHGDSGSSPKASVGTPSVKPLVLRPAEGGTAQPAASDSEVSAGERQLEAKRKAQLDQYQAWELRITTYSEAFHIALKRLQDQFNLTSAETPEGKSRRQTLEIQMMPLKIGIRRENKKDWKAKPNFDTSLIQDHYKPRLSDSVAEALF